MVENNEAAVEYIESENKEHIYKVRKLFIEYAESLGVDLEFQGFKSELDNLPGKYSHPTGSIILALVNDEPAGCVALRKISDLACEMKRLYVRDHYRGMGIGKELVERIITKARLLGYSYLRLDTLPTMDTAQNMYKNLGFYEIEPYVYNPIEGTKYLELRL